MEANIWNPQLERGNWHHYLDVIFAAASRKEGRAKKRDKQDRGEKNGEK